MTTENKENKSPMVQELQEIVDSLPKVARQFPGLKAIIQYVGKVVRRQDRLEVRVDALEKNKSTNDKTD